MSACDLNPERNPEKYGRPMKLAILLLQNAREPFYVPMYKMSMLVPSRLSRDQIKFSSVEAFKNYILSGMLIKMKCKC